MVFDFFNSDSCWYAVGTKKFQIKKVGYYPGTQLVELMELVNKYKLCQNVYMVGGAIYQYSFDVGAFLNVKTSVVNTYINMTLVNSVKVTYPPAPTYTRIMNNYTAPSTGTVQFCVDSSQ